ncbi:MBL fold metallo-hydrolase [Rubrivivax gelatinosus]|uniref:Glyoxylase-like metal-dependent hydrolase (Beta-lactamase superfamily II) n=1 Tax=Rubrivivax gelatinosus TaxID=28068 RepID=A0A4R2MGA2_RUBGE|nr:MBL fold metallo-hydrolase [Rubrivivax gelatinosus]MBK1688112.1 MBL fold metallo-hydrolase [Rubrivivax gelatinosus]TCP03837.1 glyoxylase-like metal-dependent hydrolase (beta-lactamase superfamily II) [Rubrivivax gelatinosus]
MSATALPSFVEPCGHDIYAVDTGFHRPRFDAAYLVLHGGRAAIVDAGTNHALPRILEALAALGLPHDAVDWVIPTHIHLDHAGGVGLLMQALPAARVMAHPRAARHLVDPSQIWAGASAVYGEAEMQRNYGTLVPVPADRVDSSSDGQRISLAGRTLEFADTPGHARHHHCIWDEASQGWFTGDTFGLSYREFDSERGAWLLPTSTPVQFEPEALKASVRRLLARSPRSMFLTHYGRVDDVPRLGALLLALLDEMVALGRRVAGVGEARHAALREGLEAIYRASLAEHGCTLAPAALRQLLELDIELNAQGMAIWLDREAGASR